MTVPTATPAAAALQRLATKQGLTLGAMPRADALLLLAWAARSIPAATPSSEAAVNDALRAWLARGGTMLRIDHVELRRSLVDAGFWQRDGYGRAYCRARDLPTAEATAQATALSELDPDRIVAHARDHAATARAVRKQLHLRPAGR